MPRILTRCPTTQEVVPTIMRMQRAAFDQLKGPHGFRCGKCGQIHHWDRETAWVEEAA